MSTAPPIDSLRGFVGQGMGQSKATALGQVYKVVDSTTPGAFSVTVPETGWVHVLAQAAGGSGSAQTSGADGAGAGGGGGVRRWMRVVAGQVISGNIGAAAAGANPNTDGTTGGD